MGIVLKQKPNIPYDVHAIIVTLYAGLNGFLDSLPLNQVLVFEQKLIKQIDNNEELIEILKEDGQFTEISQSLLDDLIRNILNS